MHPLGEANPPPLIGRHGEVRQLCEVLAGAATGAGAAVRVTAEAGMGKTRLVSEAVARSASAGVPVAWGAAEEAERGRPLAALAEALDVALTYHRVDAERAALTGDAIWLAIDGVLEVVESRTATEPLVLVLDDLQWADQGTWMAAAALARRAPALGLALITLHRPLLPSAAVPVPLGALGTELDLGPLAPEDAQALGASVLGSSVGEAATVQLARAAGNAFFTIEIARWLSEPGVTATLDEQAEEVTVPAVLRETVLRRVDALAPETAAVVRSAALMGRRTTVSELATLTSQPLDVVARGVEDAQAVGVLVDDPRGVVFRHDLVCAAVRADTPPAAIAAHLATVERAAVADPWTARQLAAWTPAGDHEVARVVTAAARAPDIAPEAAAELLQEVLRIGPAPEEEPGAVETEFVVHIGRSGDLDAASKAAQDLLDQAAGTAHDAHLDELRRLTGRIDIGRGAMDAAVATLSGLASGQGPVAEQARSDLHLVEVLTLRRPEAVEDARAERRASTDPTVRCNADLAVAVHAMRAGHTDESVEAATSAVAQAALEPMLTVEVHPEVFLANALFYAERFDEAARAVGHARAAAERAGIVWPIPHHLAHVAGAAMRIGDFDTATTASHEAIGWSLDTGQRIAATWPHVLIAVAAVHTGDIDDARASIAAAEADLAAGQWQGTEAVPWAAALVAEADGDVAAAAARLVPLVELAHAVEWNSRVPLVAPEAARMAWLAGDGDAVERIASIVDAIAGLPMVEATAAQHRCRGLAEGTVEQLEAAAEQYQSIGSAAHAGATWAEAALVAARHADHDRARDLFQHQARPRLEAIGAHGVVARTVAGFPVRLQRRIGRRPARPAEGIAALTPAETQVALLVSTGASNGEIAAELFISRRTVESHLSRIYRKLGVTSRVRLAAVLAQELNE